MLRYILAELNPKCYKDGYVKSFFLRTTAIWNSLPVEYFPLTYDPNCSKFRVNRYLIFISFFDQRSSELFLFAFSFSVISVPQHCLINLIRGVLNYKTNNYGMTVYIHI